jgi:hypothetical protein
MTVEQRRALALAQARLRAQQPKDYRAMSAPVPVDPTEGMSGLEKFNAGMGKAFTDIGRGAAQMVGMGPSGEEVQEQRQLDAPLMKTGAGIAGNVAGNIAAMAPMAVIPGAATVGGAGALGLTAASLQPTITPEERLKNQAFGGVLGAATQFAGSTGAKKVGEWAAGRQADMAAQQSRNAVRDATLREAHAAGYVVPPSAVGTSNIGKAIESVAGKAAIGQEAALRNQEVTNRLARRALGMADDAPLSEAAIKALRKTAAGPYKEVAAMSPVAAQNLEALKNARHGATAHFRHYGVSADPKALAEAQRLAQQAEGLESMLEQTAQQAGKPTLVKALREARKQIAKTYEVEKALNVATGDVSARALGRSLDKGKPLSGELATAGRFAEAFGPYAREAASVGTPGVSKVGALASALMSGGGAAAAGPLGAGAGLLPFVAPPMARSAMLSKPVQDAITNPSYRTGAVVNSASALNDPETRRRVAMLARALALPAIPEAVNQ